MALPTGTGSSPASVRGWMQGFRALRNYNYRLYFSGQFISLVGTWMQNIAQGWLVLQLTHSAFDLGLVTMLQSLPMLVLGLAGGVLADRVPKHRLLVGTQAAMALLALILAVDVSAGTVQIWHVYLLATLLGVANVINMPSQQSFTVEMVGKEDLMNAVALNSALFNSARIVGPAIAGVLIAVAGIALCFYLNALSFLAVIVGLLLMRPNEFRIRGAVQRGGSARAQLAEGLDYVRRTPFARTVLIMAAAFGMFAFNWNVILPLFADRVLHVGATGFGIMSSAFGIGALLAAFTLAFARRARWSVMVAGMAGFALFTLLFAWTRAFPLALLFLAASGTANLSFTSQANTTVQTMVPDALRGRMMSLYLMVIVGAQPPGAFLTGVMASLWGAPTSLSIGALTCALVLGLVLITARGQNRAIVAGDLETAPLTT